ncbi:MAG TPA: hypothetical protein VJV79_04055 [Polyangiaceae bacterium]|nr:hypothetical protein [Polyangiaceae bacterium]
MKIRDVKAAVLQRLYEEYKAHGRNWGIDLEDLQAAAPAALDGVVEDVMEDFVSRGLVECEPTMDISCIRLTIDGIEAVEEPGTEAFELVQHVQNITIASSSGFQVGNQNTQKVTYSTVLESLKERVQSSTMAPQTRMDLLNAIDILQRDPISSSRP